MTRWSRRSFAAAGAISAAGGLLTGCGGSPGAAGDEDARQRAGDGTGNVVFWAWAAGLDGIVEEFNSLQSDITVELSPVASGDEAYKKLQTSVSSGTGPDLAQVEYSQIPSLAISGTLQDVAALDSRYADHYETANWKLAGFEGGRHYGIPNDQGPLVMYYNEDLLHDAGIEDAPETWDEYRDAGAALKEATGARLGTLLQDSSFLAGLAEQAGAQWFDIDGDSWVVDIADDATRRAMDFWIGLAKDGLVTVDPGFNTGFWQELDARKCATNVVGLWGYRGMKGNLQETAGQWRAGQCPRWSEDDGRNGNHGGSVWAVTRSSKNVSAALAFADWLAANPASMNAQYDSSGYFPAAADPSAVKGYSQPDDFFGGQRMLKTFERAGAAVQTGWVWGPQFSELTGMLGDRLPDAVRAGDSEEYLRGIQKDFVKSLRTRGLSVVER